MILDIDEISPDASSDTLRDQIRVRREYLPRLTTPALVAQMKREIQELLTRRDRRGD